MRACRLAPCSRAAWYRKSRAKDQTALRLRIRELAHARPRFGVLRIWVLLCREGWFVNKKRVRRLYRLDGLQLRIRVRRRKHHALHREPAPTPTGPTARWSMDFVHDALAAGRPFRILTVIDQWSRHSPLREVAARQSGQTVGEALDRVLPSPPRPRSITVDHGTEFQSRALEDWASHRGVRLDFIRLGKPVENAFIESCNGRLRDECLNVHQFESLVDARATIEAWRVDYNQCRPHSSLGHLTPNEFAAVFATAFAAGLSGCGGESATGQDEPGGISPQMMADALQTVIASDRTVYTRHVVNRLQDEEGIIEVSEHWQANKALPLPSQMFRMGAELAAAPLRSAGDAEPLRLVRRPTA